MEILWFLGVLGVGGALYVAFELGKAFGVEGAKSWGQSADQLVDVISRESGAHLLERRKLQEVIDRFQVDRHRIREAARTFQHLLSDLDTKLTADRCGPIIESTCDLIEIGFLDREFEDEDLAGSREARNQADSFRNDQAEMQAHRRDDEAAEAASREFRERCERLSCSDLRHLIDSAYSDASSEDLPWPMRRFRQIALEVEAIKTAGISNGARAGDRVDEVAPGIPRSVDDLEVQIAELLKGYKVAEESFERHSKAADEVARSVIRMAEEERREAVDKMKQVRKELRRSHEALGLLQMASVLIREPGRQMADGKVEYLWFGSSIDGAFNADVILDASKNGNRAMRMPEPWKAQIAKEWGVLKR